MQLDLFAPTRTWFVVEHQGAIGGAWESASDARAVAARIRGVVRRLSWSELRAAWMQQRTPPTERGE